MKKMQIAICSYRRSDKIFNLTIASLIRSGANLEDVTVFISDPAEHQAYVEGTGGLVKIVDSVPTLSGNRSFVMNYYPKGTKIVFVDDDIKAFERLQDGKLVETNFYAFANKGFEWCEKEGKTIWGIYAARNAFFMKDRVTEGLFLPVGCCYGLVNTRQESHFITSDEKEDYRRGFQTFGVEGGLIRLENITVNTAYYKEGGGMQVKRTDKIIERAAKLLAEDYPDYCKVYQSKGKGTWELRLNNSTYKTKVLESPVVL
jgi:hypothetical protein